MQPIHRLLNSRVDHVQFRGYPVYIKRDDLLSEAFSGNKARKFFHYLVNDFDGIETILSYGSPQSNALYSLSVLSRIKNWQLDFYVDHIPHWLKQNPLGNYAAALKNGAHIISLEEVTPAIKNDIHMQNPIENYLRETILPQRPKSLLIPEGGRCHYAETGIKILAEEISHWAAAKKIKQLKVFLPSGTGTTALYLQKHLRFPVYTCACVGDADYLQQQFLQLSDHLADHPSILSTGKKFHFGKLYRSFYTIWQELRQQTGITFDLLYDPLGWLTFVQLLQESSASSTLLYIHQGGLLGNQSMLKRYQRKFPDPD